MSFAEVLKQVKSLSYEVIVFDTAPTGHTLRFLQFPTVLEKALAKFSTLGRSFGPMLNQVSMRPTSEERCCENSIIKLRLFLLL